jgi:hypothetical protein
MLKFVNIALEFLLEFGMHYPCLSLAIDKCCLLFVVEFFLCIFFMNMKKKLLLLFDNVLYIVYYGLVAIYI